MKGFLLPLFFLAGTFSLPAQSSDRDDVKDAIDLFFTGMYHADTALVRSTLAREARLMSVSEAGELKVESMDKFLQSVATSKGPGFFHEKIWNYDIHMELPIASVVTDYTFFLDGKQSHCGINAFQLARVNEGWKIIQIIDTRRKEGCRDDQYNLTDTLHRFLDAWHHAAAVADEDAFFGSMAPQGIYLGTDANERWERDYMAFWAKPYFDKESAWAFKARDRHIYLNDAQSIAWFEEKLDTWMGECRGSGVLRLYPEGWKIEHYNLAVTIPNDKMDKFLKKIRKQKR